MLMKKYQSAGKRSLVRDSVDKHKWIPAKFLDQAVNENATQLSSLFFPLLSLEDGHKLSPLTILLKPVINLHEYVFFCERDWFCVLPQFCCSVVLTHNSEALCPV